MLSPQLRPTLYNPTDCNPPGSSVRGSLQARRLEWFVLPSSRGSTQPRMKRAPPAWQADSLPLGHQGTPGIFSVLGRCQLPFPRHSAPPKGSRAMPTTEKHHLPLGGPHPHHVKLPGLAQTSPLPPSPRPRAIPCSKKGLFPPSDYPCKGAVNTS